MVNFENKLIDVVKLSQKSCEYPIQCNLVYATRENFLGRRVDGYHPNATHIALATPKAAHAVCQVQNKLNQMQLGLIIFDSYRPLRAVRDFKYWMHAPVESDYELERKAIHYPHIDKSQASILGYLADDVSNHCFGDTIDLALIDLKTGLLLDMGACFDYFDEISYPSAPASVIGEQAFKNRLLLSDAMLEAGFIPYEKEFWHFTYKDREITVPMDFEITSDLEGIGT
jgi:D-alanyl-D-alanine dipeptidase